MKQYAVIGLGLFGYSVAIELSRLGNEVLAIDKNEEIVDKIAENVSHAVVCDVTSEGALMELDYLTLTAALYVLVTILKPWYLQP